MFALRTDSGLASVKAWADRLELGGFAVREVAGDNEHWHWLLESSKTIKQLRSSLTRDCKELVGNKSYSLTAVKELDKYVRYMSKGESEGVMPEIAWVNSLVYTPEKIKELHEAYWAENKKMKKRSAGTMIDWVVDEAKRQGIAWEKREVLAKMYIRELGVRGKAINLHSIRANLNTVQVALCPDDAALTVLADNCANY